MSNTTTFWRDLAEGEKRLRSGEPVAIPTETVYGLAAPISDEKALKEVFRLKARPFFDPLIVHIADKSDMYSVADAVPEFAKQLAAEFWPGPLTFVLPKARHVNPLITSGLETVGVRCPSHPFARRLIRRLGTPLAAPSANRFGKTSPTRAEHVLSEWPNGEVFVVNGGPCSIGLESTVLEVKELSTETLVNILRPGAITKEMIEEYASRSLVSVTVGRESTLASPGNLEHHYMPEVPLIILGFDDRTLGAIEMKEVESELGFQNARYRELTLDEDPVIAARMLYENLRLLSDRDYIIVRRRKCQEGELWDAIWDRLSRASTKLRATNL